VRSLNIHSTSALEVYKIWIPCRFILIITKQKEKFLNFQNLQVFIHSNIYRITTQIREETLLAAIFQVCITSDFSSLLLALPSSPRLYLKFLVLMLLANVPLPLQTQSPPKTSCYLTSTKPPSLMPLLEAGIVLSHVRSVMRFSCGLADIAKVAFTDPNSNTSTTCSADW
jgi:hypothetical protein